MWSFNPGFFTENKDCRGDLGRPTVVEIRGFSGLIKVVHSNFIDSLKRVIELSCLIPQLPKPGNTKKDENEKSDTQRNPLYFCNQFLNLNNSIIKQLVVDSKYLITTQNNITGSMLMSLSGVWLTTMFLLLCLRKLKFCIYTPRGSVTDVLNFLQISPNWAGGIIPFNQLGLFYYR